MCLVVTRLQFLKLKAIRRKTEDNVPWNMGCVCFIVIVLEVAFCLNVLLANAYS